MDFMLFSKTFDGDDGMEDDVPPAEMTLTERSLSWGFSWRFNDDKIPILVEDLDEPGGNVDLGDEDSRDEDMKLKMLRCAGKMGVISRELIF